MFKKLQTKERGFTIIEVLIVLAIAGLIMLVVFLAVPALQRNQRNAAKRSEVSRIGSAANEFVANNNGVLPNNSLSSTATTDAAKILRNSNNRDVTLLQVRNRTGAAPTVQTTAIIEKVAKCTTGGTTTAGQGRSMALLFLVETSTGTQAVCLDI